MPIQELTLADVESRWPRLSALYNGEDSGRERLRDLLSGEGSYALLAEGEGGDSGIAVVGHYESAWIFNDSIAAIREFAVADTPSREELIGEIERRARAAGMTHLSRFTRGDDPLLAWWYDGGFFEYMAAFRRRIDETESDAGNNADDCIQIRAVTDLERDWPKLWPLLSGLHDHHASLTGSSLRPNREASDRSDMEEELAGGTSLVMLAEIEGRAIGTSSAELGARHADGTRTGYRSKLFIDPAYRGRGIAGRFEAVAVPWFREHGVSHVERWIVAGNERPRQIWAARGYKPDHVLLRKKLDS